MIHPERLDALTAELMSRQRGHDVPNHDQTYLVEVAQQTPEDNIYLEHQRKGNPRLLSLLKKIFPEN
jgi:hypothetical protein